MTDRRPVVLVFARCYLPGFKAGGPIRTIANMVEALGDDIDFLIVTSDRDLGDLARYPTVESGVWNQVGKARVRYLSPRELSLFGIAKIVRGLYSDFVYLNSFFDPVFTLNPILLRWVGFRSMGKVVLAPRGEFSLGALAIKSKKKSLFLRVSSFLGLFKDAVWHASNDAEAGDVRRVLGRSTVLKIHVAENLASGGRVCQNSSLSVSSSPRSNFDSGVLRVCFLSRISPMKNLDFALRVLAKVVSNIQFDVVGPIEDERYWGECQFLVQSLPKNVVFSYLGAVEHNQVAEVISKYDLFFVPSRGENFGHVFLEALLVGVPILVSDKTPWRCLEDKGIGWDFSLEDPESFSLAVDRFAQADGHTKSLMIERCRAFAVNLVGSQEVLSRNKGLFGLV